MKSETSKAVGTVHRSEVWGTYHPVPYSGERHHEAQCHACGWRWRAPGGSKRDRVEAVEAGEAHKGTCPLGKPDVITVTWNDPEAGAVARWTINDTRGYLDAGPACDECDACECDDCPVTRSPLCKCACPGGVNAGYHGDEESDHECIGLSFAFVCLDGGESLCEDCAEKEGIQIIECDCE